MTIDPIDKVIDQSVSTAVEGVANFLGSICKPAAEELGLLLRDKVKFYRAKNLLKIQEKIEILLSNQKIKETPVSPKFLKAFVDDASWEDDDEIQNLWAGLVAGEIKYGSRSDEAIIYTELLKSMSAYEARIIKLVYGDDRIADLLSISFQSAKVFETLVPIDIPIVEILKASPVPLDYIVKDHSHKDIIKNKKDHSLAFGFVTPQLHSLTRKGLLQEWSNSPNVLTRNNSVRFTPSVLGLDLYMRGTGYKIYPIEAYVLTRKHWRGELE